MFALAQYLVSKILLPLVSPFIDLMFVAGVVHYLLDRQFPSGGGECLPTSKNC